MARKKRTEIHMSQKTLPTICTECGKKFERYGADWGYVKETKSSIRAFYCSYRCMKADERRQYETIKARAAMICGG